MATRAIAPIVPEDLTRNGRSEVRSFHRALVGLIRGHIDHEPPDTFVRRTWADDSRAAIYLARAASNPATTTTAAALTRLQVSPLALLAPTSAGAAVLDRGRKLSFDGTTRYQIPNVQSHGQPPLFVAEGGVSPVIMAATQATVIGPPSKLSFVAGITDELQRATGEDATTLVGAIMGESLARGLDAAVFGNAAASAAQPAGLIAGLVSLTPTAAAGTIIDAIAGDIATFASYFAANNINSENLVLCCNPAQACRLKMVLGYQPSVLSGTLPVLMSPAISAKQIVAVIPEGLYSHASAIQAEISNQAIVHYEDTAPQDIATPGTPVVVAAPVRSTFQTASLLLKLRLRTTWCALPNTVAYMNNVNW
jgi:hypothetical protein